MSGFAYVVSRNGVRSLDAHDATRLRRGFVWIHLTSRDEEVQAWLRDVAKLDRFTVEALTGPSDTEYAISPHGRYSHTRHYLERVLREVNLRPEIVATELRLEAGAPVQGLVVTATR